MPAWGWNINSGSEGNGSQGQGQGSNYATQPYDPYQGDQSRATGNVNGSAGFGDPNAWHPDSGGSDPNWHPPDQGQPADQYQGLPGTDPFQAFRNAEQHPGSIQYDPGQPDPGVLPPGHHDTSGYPQPPRSGGGGGGGGGGSPAAAELPQNIQYDKQKHMYHIYGLGGKKEWEYKNVGDVYNSVNEQIKSSYAPEYWAQNALLEDQQWQNQKDKWASDAGRFAGMGQTGYKAPGFAAWTGLG